MPKRILVPLDGTPGAEHVLDLVADVARGGGASARRAVRSVRLMRPLAAARSILESRPEKALRVVPAVVASVAATM